MLVCCKMNARSRRKRGFDEKLYEARIMTLPPSSCVTPLDDEVCVTVSAARGVSSGFLECKGFRMLAKNLRLRTMFFSTETSFSNRA